ncbi:MAG: hypothetical protein Fur0012_14390 [Elusimicrobiota bacterium]
MILRKTRLIRAKNNLNFDEAIQKKYGGALEKKKLTEHLSFMASKKNSTMETNPSGLLIILFPQSELSCGAVTEIQIEHLPS